MSKEPNRRVAALIRVSTKDQADDDRAGIPRQQEVIRRTIAAKKLNCVETVQLSDVSGTNVRNCPEIRALLSDISTGKLDGLVVADIDRLLRPSEIEDIALLQAFQDSGAILYSGDAEYDLSTDSGILMGGIQALLAGHELRQIKRRLLGAKEEKRKLGKCPSAHITLPLGISYDRETEKFRYNSEITKVQEAFRLVDETGITNYCQLQTLTGIHHRTLHNILRNTIYTGIRSYMKKRGKEKYVGKDGRQSDRKKVDRLPNDIIRVKVIDQPAVPLERFERVQMMLGAIHGKWRTRRTSNPAFNMGTGVTFCGYCEAPLYCTSEKRTNRKSHGYYMCKKNYYLYRKTTGGCSMPNVRKDALDQTILEFTATQLSQPAVVTSIISHHLESIGIAHHQRVSPVRQDAVDDVARRRERLIELYEKELITIAEFKHRQSRLESGQAGAKPAAESPKKPEEQPNPQEIARLIVKGALSFSRIQTKEKQKVAIQQLFARLVVKDAQIVGFQLSPRFNADVCERGIPTDTGSSPRPA